jgi:hypothetical protein
LSTIYLSTEQYYFLNMLIWFYSCLLDIWFYIYLHIKVLAEQFKFILWIHFVEHDRLYLVGVFLKSMWSVVCSTFIAWWLAKLYAAHKNAGTSPAFFAIFYSCLLDIWFYIYLLIKVLAEQFKFFLWIQFVEHDRLYLVGVFLKSM